MSEESKVGHGASVLRVVVFNAHKLTLIHQHHDTCTYTHSECKEKISSFSFLAVFFILKKSVTVSMDGFS